MIDVVALGELLIDFAAKSTDAAGYPTMAANPGGAPGNFLAALNAYGRKTAFLGKVGNDTFGHLLLGTLSRAGIETKGILVDDHFFTTLAFVTFDDTGDRSFAFARKPGADTQLTWEEIDKSLIDEARVFHFGTLSLTDEPVRTATQKAVAYAREKGIQIIGDIPIYVAFDSADTWAGPELFQLDEKGMPTGVAGCPPDAFSATGQLWGNPLYRWDYHRQTGYEWWLRRISYCFELYDVVRIDHFRGFDEYYSIPYGNRTAEFGKWEPGPGYELFKVMKEKLGNKPVIAEDLGYLTPSVRKLVKKTGYPGMKILQFAFDESEKSDYLPYHYTTNSVVYTGTHDNDTTVGWYASLSRHDKGFLKKYLHIKNGKTVHLDLIRAALGSVSDTAVIPMQDYLGLGSEARINMPSTLGDNWKWRMKKGQISGELAKQVCELSRLYGRTGE